MTSWTLATDPVNTAKPIAEAREPSIAHGHRFTLERTTWGDRTPGAEPIEAAKALLESVRAPGQVGVNEKVRGLEILALLSYRAEDEQCCTRPR